MMDSRCTNLYLTDLWRKSYPTCHVGYRKIAQFCRVLARNEICLYLNCAEEFWINPAFCSFENKANFIFHLLWVLLIFELSWVLFTFCVMDEKWGCATPKEKLAAVKNSVIVEHQPRKFSSKNFSINFVRVANKRQVWRQVNLSFIFLILDRMLTQKDFYLEVQRATQVKPGKLKFAFLSYEFKIKWNFQGRKIVKWAWFGASVINNFN